MPNYPAQIDTPQSLPTAVDNLTPVYGAIFNRLRDAVIAIESELGVKPSGQYGSVGARLITLEGVVGNLKIIELEGDLGGTLETPRIIGIQGYPVSPVQPQFNQVMVWDGIAWTPQNQSGGGGGGGFNPPAGTSPGQTLIWTGSGYAPEFYEADDLTPPLQALLSGLTLAEVNQTLSNPAFTAQYSQTPSSALLKDSDNNTNQNVTSTPNSFNSGHSFTKFTFGQSVTFTLTATEGHTTKTSQVTTTWGQKLYWGTGPAGQGGGSFITSLLGSQITTDKLFSFNIIPGATDKIYFACRSAYGNVIFTINGLQGGFTKVNNFSVMNAFGFQESYDLYESDQVNLGNVFVFTGNGNDEFALPGGPVGPIGPQGPAGGGGSGPGGLIVDADVSPVAAIQGTKIIPHFGNQTVTTKTSMLATEYDLYPIRVPTDSNTTICWTFDETSQPFHNSGTGGLQNLTFSPVNPSAFADGLFVNAFNMEGEVATCGNSPISIGTTACTLSAWVFPSALFSGPVIAKNYNTGATHNVPYDAISLNMGNNDGSFIFRVTTTDTSLNTDLVSPASLIQNGKWNFVGLTWDGFTLTGYINGIQAAQTTIGSGPSGTLSLDYGSNGTWFIGAIAGTDGAPNLIIDDVRAESVVRDAQYFDDIWTSAIFPFMATTRKPGWVELQGDITGNGFHPTVQGLLTRPLDKNVAPQDGYVLGWDGYRWLPLDVATALSLEGGGGGGGGGVGTLSGDVSGVVPGPVVVTGLQTNPVSNAAPNVNDVLTWNGASWAPAVGGGSSSLSGDVVGVTSSNTVIAVRNRIFGGGAPNDGDTYIWNSLSNQWIPGLPTQRKLTIVYGSVTGSNYTALASDDLIIVNNDIPSNMSVLLPNTPIPLGKVITVLDGLGTANNGTKYIRISQSVGSIIPTSDMDALDYGGEILRNPGQSKTFIWDGSNWHYVSQFIRQEDNGLGWIFAQNTISIGKYSQSVACLTNRGAVTINLPKVSNPFTNNPIEISIKDRDGVASTNNINIVPAAGDFIDNSSSNYVINTNYGFVRLSLIENLWYIIGKG